MRAIQKGFTLIELMIVVAIIGILAAVAIPAYQGYIARSQLAEGLSLADGLKTSVAEVYGNNATCPTNSSTTLASQYGIPLDTTVSGQYVLKVDAQGTYTSTGGCQIQATMQPTPQVSGKVASATLTLTMTDNGGSLSWACTSSAKQQYVPKACVGS